MVFYLRPLSAMVHCLMLYFNLTIRIRKKCSKYTYLCFQNLKNIFFLFPNSKFEKIKILVEFLTNSLRSTIATVRLNPIIKMIQQQLQIFILPFAFFSKVNLYLDHLIPSVELKFYSANSKFDLSS